MTTSAKLIEEKTVEPYRTKFMVEIDLSDIPKDYMAKTITELEELKNHLSYDSWINQLIKIIKKENN